MKSNTEDAEWWVFFPFVGLAITDQNHGLNHPMLTNFHVIESRHLKGVAKYIKYDPKTRKDIAPNISQAEISSFLNSLGDEFDSLIAVRSSKKTDENVYEAARYSARLISATISLALFSSQMSIHYCSLLENLSRLETEKRVAFRTDRKGMSFLMNGHAGKRRNIYVTPKAFKISRRNLRKSILDRNLGFGRLLFSVVDLSPQTILLIKTAILTLDDALRQRDQSLQFLGCVTTIDSLFGGKVNFELLKKRVCTILNKRTFDFLQVDKIFAARNAFVHEGERVVDHKLVQSAIHLSLMCLISFSNNMPFFQNKKILCSALDNIEVYQKHPPKSETKVDRETKTTIARIRTQFKKLHNIPYTKHFVHQDGW